MPYALSGWVCKNRPKFGSVYLGMEWWDSSGEIGPPVDSDILSDDVPNYRRLCMPSECNGDGVRAPPNAVKARIEAMAVRTPPNPETPVFFDDLSFTSQGWKVCVPLIVKDQ